jgi:hypothetical protein
VTSFLKVFKFIAVVLVALCIPASILLSLTFVMFCDTGPVSACLLRSVTVLGILAAQVVSLIAGWASLKRQRVLLAGSLMILSILPVPVALFFLVH